MEQRAAKIENGIVTNILIIDSSTPKELYDVKLKKENEVSIGWKYEDGRFIEPEQPKLDDEPESA